MAWKIKTAEASSTDVIPPDFPSLLADALAKISAYNVDQTTSGFVSPVLTAEFEADALIKGRYHKGKSHVIMSTNADIPTDVGDECSVGDVFTCGKLKIASASKASMDGAISLLIPNSQSCVKALEATSPVYKGVKSMKPRGLISVVLGGDACPGGVKDVGTKKLAKRWPRFKTVVVLTKKRYSTN